MKKEMIEFLIKRIGKKVDDIIEYPNHENYELLESVVEDFYVYWNELKAIVIEVLS